MYRGQRIPDRGLRDLEVFGRIHVREERSVDAVEQGVVAAPDERLVVGAGGLKPAVLLPACLLLSQVLLRPHVEVVPQTQQHQSQDGTGADGRQAGGGRAAPGPFP